MADRFSPRGKILVLRLSRLGRTPPALYATQILTEQGFDVVVAEYGAFRENQTHVDGPFPRVRFASPWARWIPRPLRAASIFAVMALRLVAWIARTGRPSLIISHGINEQAVALLLHFLFRVKFIAHVHEIHRAPELSGFNRLLLKLEGPALRAALFCIFPEKTRAEIYVKRYRLSESPVVAFNCPRREPDLTTGPIDLRRTLGLPADATLLGYVGGLGPSCALEDGIRAVARLPKLYFLIWSGWGDSGWLEKLKELAKGTGAESRVKFLGRLDEKEKRATLEGLDFGYCVYVPRELRLQFLASASNKLTESLAAGLPVIANHLPDFRALVETNDVGLCIQELSVDSIADTLRKLTQDKLGQKRRSTNARTAYRSWLNYDAQFAPVLERFRAELGPTAATPHRTTG